MKEGLEASRGTKIVIKQNDNMTKVMSSVTRLGNLLDFGQLFKAFGSN